MLLLIGKNQLNNPGRYLCLGCGLWWYWKYSSGWQPRCDCMKFAVLDTERVPLVAGVWQESAA